MPVVEITFLPVEINTNVSLDSPLPNLNIKSAKMSFGDYITIQSIGELTNTRIRYGPNINGPNINGPNI